MKTKGQMAAVVLVAVLLLACAFAIGMRFERRTMYQQATAELNGVQAMLAFNRMQDERHVRELLSQGCATQAAELLDYLTDQDMGVLSDVIKRRIDSDTSKYLTDRDPKILVELMTFKSKYGTAWMEKPCKPG